MNYLKFKARKRQQQLDFRSGRGTALAEIEGLLEQATSLKNQLIQSNLRIAVMWRENTRGPGGLSELISDAEYLAMARWSVLICAG